MFLGVVVLALLAGCGGGDGDGTEPAPPVAAAPTPGGGLSIEEALASDLDGPLMVKGFVVVTGRETRLCSALAESFPPQCGGPSLRVEGDVGDVAFQQERDVRWTETEVSLLGDVEGDVLRVSETSQ